MSQIVLDVIVISGAVLLAASVILALYRIVRGPSILDRMIGTDVVLAAIMCGLGGYMALSDRTDLLPVLIVLAMLGFVGSVSVSRYVSKSDSMTPGAEAGALSDFSSSDWHMPRETAADSAERATSDPAETATSDSAEAADDSTEAAGRTQPRAESGAEPAQTVRPSGEVDEVTEIADSSYDSHADAGGEGEGTGPDAGPDDAEHMSSGEGEGNNRGS
ncbi:monovalent cation/H+ antiporter complex subunit F [Brevibacterium spongiae]|uniref:Monovalent cation/H+ antiporter complex subunit F n=1 Tax=Brevibacterium spongiae TaxID=2909672 RepID=A0ABY5SS44_9MICO|nr:monovalent cation/H+ antiporter complex subunit F [Brevibacterium spongiae]UVI35889.1 monovalent cation/H+ antiporter complex subunit F [Brevibacterium spongiae]